MQDDLDAPLVVPARPPRQWFEELPDWFDPEGSLVQIDFDTGRVAALVAPYGECILDGGQNCWTPPESKTGYDYAHVGTIVTAEGDKVRIANIGGSVPHASLHASASVAQDHYSNTATRRMLGRYIDSPESGGIVFVGTMWPGTTERDALEVMTSALSGDWRYIASLKGYEMVGAQLVNNPGFRPVPKAKTAAAFTVLMVAPRVASAGHVVAEQVVGEWVPDIEPVSLADVADRLERIATAVAVLMDDDDPWDELDDLDSIANSECLSCRGDGCNRCDWVGYFEAVTAAIPKRRKRSKSDIGAMARDTLLRKAKEALGKADSDGTAKYVKHRRRGGQIVPVYHDPSTGRFATPGTVSRKALNMLMSPRGNQAARGRQEIREVAAKKFYGSRDINDFRLNVLGERPADDGTVETRELQRAWDRADIEVKRLFGEWETGPYRAERQKRLRQPQQQVDALKAVEPQRLEVARRSDTPEELEARRQRLATGPTMPQDDRKFGKPLQPGTPEAVLYQRWDWDEKQQEWVPSQDDPDRRGPEYDQAVSDVNAQVAEMAPAKPETIDQRIADLERLFADGQGQNSVLNTAASHNKLGGNADEWTPARQRMHAELIAEVMDKIRQCAAVGKGRKASLLGGLPGAGKTSSLKAGGAAEKLSIAAYEIDVDECPQGVADGDGYVSLNVDALKVLMARKHLENPDAGWLPPIDGLSPLEMSTFMHEETAHLDRLLEDTLLAEGYNVVYDGALSDRARVDLQLTRLRDNGYETPSLLLVDVPMEESANSAAFRYRKDELDPAVPEGGRFAPKYVTFSRGATNGARSASRQVAESLIEDGLVGDFVVVLNDGISRGGPKEALGEAVWQRITGADGVPVEIRPFNDSPPVGSDGLPVFQSRLEKRVIEALKAEGIQPPVGERNPDGTYVDPQFTSERDVIAAEAAYQQAFDRKAKEMQAAGELEPEWYDTPLGVLQYLSDREFERTNGPKPADPAARTAWLSAQSKARVAYEQRVIGAERAAMADDPDRPDLGRASENPFVFTYDTSGMTEEQAEQEIARVMKEIAPMLEEGSFYVKIQDVNSDPAYTPEQAQRLALGTLATDALPLIQKRFQRITALDAFRGSTDVDAMPAELRLERDKIIKDGGGVDEVDPVDATNQAVKNLVKIAKNDFKKELRQLFGDTIDLCRFGVTKANPFCGDVDAETEGARRKRSDMPQAASPLGDSIEGSSVRPAGMTDDVVDRAKDAGSKWQEGGRQGPAPLIRIGDTDTFLTVPEADANGNMYYVDETGARVSDAYLNGAGWANTETAAFDFLQDYLGLKVATRADDGTYRYDDDDQTPADLSLDELIDRLMPTQTEIDLVKTTTIVFDDVRHLDKDEAAQAEAMQKLAPGVMLVFKTNNDDGTSDYWILDGHHRAMAYKLDRQLAENMGLGKPGNVGLQGSFAVLEQNDQIKDPQEALNVLTVFFTGMGIPTADLDGNPDTVEFASTRKAAGRMTTAALYQLMAYDADQKRQGKPGFVGSVSDILREELMSRDLDQLTAFGDTHAANVGSDVPQVDTALIDAVEERIAALRAGDLPNLGLSSGQVRNLSGVMGGTGKPDDPFVVSNLDDAATILAGSDFQILIDLPGENDAAKLGALTDLVVAELEQLGDDRTVDLSRVRIPEGSFTLQTAYEQKKRMTMPQFASRRTLSDGTLAIARGSLADRKPVTQRADGSEQWPNVAGDYLAELDDRGVYIVENTVMDPRELMASQSEVNLAGVNDILQDMRARIARGEPPVAEGEILVNGQGFIVDGHHRGIAYQILAAEQGLPLEVPVTVVDMDIVEVLDDGIVFAGMMGLPPSDLEGRPDLTFGLENPASPMNSALGRMSLELLERYLDKYGSDMPADVRSAMEAEVRRKERRAKSYLDLLRVDSGSWGPGTIDLRVDDEGRIVRANQ